MTTQSDNTLEGILKKFAIDTHEVRPGQDETLNFDNAKAALTKWRDDAIAAHTNAEIAKAKLEAFDVAFDCHDYDRLRAYRAELLKEVK